MKLTRIARRLASLSGGEIATRLRQASSARIDAARHQLGLAPVQPLLADSPAAPGKFFFDSDDALSLAALWKQTEPALAEATVARARQILTGRYPILGYDAVDFGTPPDFQLDAVNNIRAPFVPFPAVPYLDYRAVGDHKVQWELGRHQHLVTLARAYLFTGEATFAHEALAHWRLWCEKNPYPLGIHWTSTLEVAFRILSWMWLDHLLAATPISSPALRQEFAARIAHGAWYIERYLSTYFAPNTHLLGEAVALFAAGAVYRQYRDASRWAREGWRIVNEEASHQVFPDGFHFEQSTYYHVYALDFFLHARQLGVRNGLDPAALNVVLKRMCSALAAISSGGQTPRFGDDDGGRLFDSARNRTPHLLDPLTTGALLFPREPWCAQMPGPREESLWLTGPDMWRHLQSIPRDSKAPEARLFLQSGYVCLPEGNALLVADAGPHGWGNGGHGHADALSLQLIVDGAPILGDPGTGTYPMDTAARNLLRLTSAHSTLEVDGEGQAIPAASFQWRQQPTVRIDLFASGPRGAAGVASHDGYARLADPVYHQRAIVSLPCLGWVVRDRAQAKSKHRLALRWQLAPGVQASGSANSWTLAGLSGQKLSLVWAAGGQWRAELRATKFSPVYGKIEAASALELTGDTGEIATLLSLADGDWRIELQSATPGLSHYRISSAVGSYSVWFANKTEPWTWQSVQTDARLVVARYGADDQPDSVWLAGVRKCEIGGKALLDSAAEMEYQELAPADWPKGI